MPASPKEQPFPQPDTAKEADSTKPVEDEKGDELKDTEQEGENADGQGESDDANPPLPDEPLPPQTEWQAIWSAAHNAYYFFNARTSETTWVNPLDPSACASQPPAEPEPAPEAEAAPEPKAATPPPDLSHLGGIDPELAYLDPTLVVPSGGSKPVPTFSARFGARDGRFTAMDGRRPEHLSEAARAQRMSSVYYDTEAWEKEIAERDAMAKADEEAGVGDKRKRLTKADIERFKAQKKAKQAMRNAWLRE